MKENQIFISYSRSDSAFVIKLEEDLARAGIFIWLDQKKISGGKLWDRAIEEALESSGILIVVVSQKSALSENVANEVQFAIDEGKTIIPILIEQTRIPLTWRRYQRIDFIEDYESGLNNIAQTIKNEMSLMINSETEKDIQRIKEEAEAKAKVEEEQRIKDETEAKADNQIKADARRIEDEKVKEEFLLKEKEEVKAKEEKQKKEKAEAKAKAEEEKRIKDEEEVKQKAEEEKRIIRQAESTNMEHELVEVSANHTETYNSKKSKYKIPLIVAGVIAVLVIVIFIVNSGNNNENYLTVSDQTSDVQDDNLEVIAWKEAVSLNTIDSYKSYQQDYMDGIYFNEAQAMINKIVDNNDWQSASTTNTKQAYQGYLDSHLTGVHVAEAKQKIAEFENLTLQENNRQRIVKPVVNVEETTERIVDNVLKAESVSHVEYQNGDFKGVFYQTGQLKWQEKNPDGVFLFNEKSRDEWSIYLLDPDRNITIQLDLYKKEILYEGSLIYNISNYSNRAN